MPRWRLGGALDLARRLKPRYLSTVTSGSADVERVSIKCGSAGNVFIDLHNIARVVTSPDPLLVYLPPFSTGFTDRPPPIPAFLRRYPTAVINYRWTGENISEERTQPPTSQSPLESDDASSYPEPVWPLPVHDTLQAYDWIINNLTPPTYTRRDVYIYGSYLGASLGTSLSLTESHPHQRIAVRGCIAYNGIYNWTTFLPDHQINKQSGVRAANILEEILGQTMGPSFQKLKELAPYLFGQPSHMFDPFASPCLFFQTPGLLVPQDFTSSADAVISMLGAAGVSSGVARESIKALMQTMGDKPPRRSPLAFPPRKSTLKIPETLLLHESLPVSTASQRRSPRRKKVVQNHFTLQAQELASLMRRSLEKLELKERSKWDEDLNDFDEIDRRVRVYDVGEEEMLYELPSQAQMLMHAWLEDRFARRM